jgi:hypothetical protein
MEVLVKLTEDEQRFIRWLAGENVGEALISPRIAVDITKKIVRAREDQWELPEPPTTEQGNHRLAALKEMEK